MQPYFFPYLGYYQLVFEVDRYVFLDDVTFIKQGYINRNAILFDGQRRDFSVPVSKISSFRFINDHEYLGDFSKFLKLIEQAYRRAPYFDDVMPLIEQVSLDSDNNVARKNAKSVAIVFEYLGMSRHFSFSSDEMIEGSYKGQDRILALCKQLGIKQYRNAIGGQDLYSREAFAAEGIELKFIQSNIHPYIQGTCDFISHLSILDVLMHCDKKTTQSMLMEYSLV